MTARDSTLDVFQFGRTSAGYVPAGYLAQLQIASTVILLFTLGIANYSLQFAQDADQAFKIPANIFGAGLGLAIWIESLAGIRNLIRTDIFMLMVLFLLTFFEFILPQDTITTVVTLNAALTAVQATFLGFAGLILGRHAFPPKYPLFRRIDFDVDPKTVVILLLGSSFLGYLSMLISVRFNILEMLYQMTWPRFTQSWSRGALGGWSTLLGEFALLKFLIPPLSATIIVQRKRFSIATTTLAIALLLLVLFEGFAGGTRNIFLIHLITFGVAFTLLIPKLSWGKLILIFSPILLIAYFAVFYLPEIRTIGLANFDLAEARTETLFVDMNLVNIALLTQVFPSNFAYLGLEIPVNALIRPIPRALWSGKPEGLSLGIEEALGATGLTLSATFVGELWMAGGFLAIFSGALLFGALAGLWNRKAAKARSSIDMIVFAVALFPAGLGMRSFLQVFPAFLPLLALTAWIRFRKT